MLDVVLYGYVYVLCFKIIFNLIKKKGKVGKDIIEYLCVMIYISMKEIKEG